MDPLTMVGAAVALLALTRKKGDTVSATSAVTISRVDSPTGGTIETQIFPDGTTQKVHLMSVDGSAGVIEELNSYTAKQELDKAGIGFTGDGKSDFDLLYNWFHTTLGNKLNEMARNPANAGYLGDYSISFVNDIYAPLLLNYTKVYPKSGLSIDPMTNKNWTLAGIRSYFQPQIRGIDIGEVFSTFKGMLAFLGNVATGNVQGAVNTAARLTSQFTR